MAMCISSFLLIGAGLLSVFAKDIMWELTEWQNRSKGLSSERTPEWETATTIGGIFALLLGVVALVLSFSSR